jgi:DNA-directed RNA polymerase subunit K/omega
MHNKRARRIRREVGAPRVDEMRNRPSVLAMRERDERQIALERRTEVERLLGDPPQGYSALDRRTRGRT